MVNSAQLALSFYDVAAGDTAWQQALAALADAAGADEAALFSSEPDQQILTSFQHGCLSRKIHQDYIDEFAAEDLQMLRAFDGPDFASISGQDLISERELRYCPVHNEYILPNDIGAQLVWFFRTSDGRGHTVALLRSHRAGPFSRQVRLLGERLLPHIKKALEFAARNVPDGERLELGPALVLDRNQHVVWANPAAERLLRKGDLAAEGNRLLLPTQGVQGFRSALDGEISHASVAWGELVGEVHALHAPTGERLGLADQDSRALLMFHQDPASQLLSPRERECLTWIARGERTAGIAARLSLTERTVNQYLNTALRKLGVRTRAEAAVQAALAGLIRP